MCPAAPISARTGARLVASTVAFADTVPHRTAPPIFARRRLIAPFGLPGVTPRLSHRQRLLRAPRDRLARGLSDTSHDPYGPVIRLRHVDGDEPYPTDAQSPKDGRIARQPLQLGDQRRDAPDLGLVQRLRQFRPVGFPPRLDLGAPRQGLCTAGKCQIVDHVALRLQTNPTQRMLGRSTLPTLQPHSCAKGPNRVQDHAVRSIQL